MSADDKFSNKIHTKEAGKKNMNNNVVAVMARIYKQIIVSSFLLTRPRSSVSPAPPATRRSAVIAAMSEEADVD